MASLTVREPTLSDAADLAALLCTDTGLREELGFAPDDRPSAAEILQHFQEWSLPRRATVHAIVVDDAAIGTITLGHRSPDGLTARIGYWIGTKHRRKGYCSRAFDAVVQLAAAEGIRSVSSSIETENIASRKIWERAGATGTPVSPGRLRYDLAVRPPG
jgi:[ribosomal protein S5]-alanine N-acetyltransferase